MESRLTPYQASALIPCQGVLVFAPHPDDEALGCGGLLAAYKAAAIPTEAVLITSGDFGEHGKAGSAVREEETRAAATILGIKQVTFWQEKDRSVAYCERTIEAARKAIIASGADLILTPSIHEIHPDHRATAWIVIEATRRLITEGKNLSVAMYEVGAPLQRVDILIDITAHEATKREAIAVYHSQLTISPYDEFIFALNRFRTYTLPTQVKYAEAYCLLTPELLRQPFLLSEAELIRQERLQLTDVAMPGVYRSANAGSGFLTKLLKLFRGSQH